MTRSYNQLLLISETTEECIFQLESDIKFKVSPCHKMLIIGHYWCLVGKGYIQCCSKGKYHNQYLHHIICPPDPETDHQDLDKLNNRIDNLRTATRTEQRRNQAVRRDSSTGVKGVSLTDDGYVAYIVVNKSKIHLGSFRTIQDAQAAREAATTKYHGEFGHF